MNDGTQTETGKPFKMENKRNADGTFPVWHPGWPWRPPGKTLKEFAREYLLNLSPEDKTKYLAELPFEIVWKMAEGNPHSTNDVVVREPPKPIADVKRKWV